VYVSLTTAPVLSNALTSYFVLAVEYTTPALFKFFKPTPTYNKPYAVNVKLGFVKSKVVPAILPPFVTLLVFCTVCIELPLAN
jgi:hypothetical protein